MGYIIIDFWKVYVNVGYIYRIFMYIDLFYSDLIILGNENLNLEEVILEEIGVKFNVVNFSFIVVFFNCDLDNLIDYVKENEEDLWMVINICLLNIKGFEVYVDYKFKVNGF